MVVRLLKLNRLSYFSGVLSTIEERICFKTFFHGTPLHDSQFLNNYDRVSFEVN